MCERGGGMLIQIQLNLGKILKKIQFDFISQKIIEKNWIFFRKFKKITKIQGRLKQILKFNIFCAKGDKYFSLGENKLFFLFFYIPVKLIS